MGGRRKFRWRHGRSDRSDCDHLGQCLGCRKYDDGRDEHLADEETRNLATLEYSIDSDGNVATVSLGGSVVFDTTVPFVGIGNNYPPVGEMRVEGAAGSNETIIALDSVNVRIAVDSNGDGVVDQTLDTTWDAL